LSFVHLVVVVHAARRYGRLASGFLRGTSLALRDRFGLMVGLVSHQTLLRPLPRPIPSPERRPPGAPPARVGVNLRSVKRESPTSKHPILPASLRKSIIWVDRPLKQ